MRSGSDEQAKVTAMASQGVVTYMLPVEVLICDRDESFWSAQVCWIAWLFGSEALDCWIFEKVKGQIAAAHSWSDDFAARRLPWSLDQPPKRALIAWFNFDPCHKHFYMGHISNYPLLHVRVRGLALTRCLANLRLNSALCYIHNYTPYSCVLCMQL